MTDHPETITVAKCHPFRDDNFYVASPGYDRSGVQYIRADIAAAKDARIAELERQLAEAREVKPHHAERLAKEMQAIVAADRWKGRDLSAAPPEKWGHLRPETRQFWIDTAARILSALKETL